MCAADPEDIPGGDPELLSSALAAAGSVAFQWALSTGQIRVAGATEILGLPPDSSETTLDQVLSLIPSDHHALVRADIDEAQRSGLLSARWCLGGNGSLAAGWLSVRGKLLARKSGSPPELAGLLLKLPADGDAQSGARCGDQALQERLSELEAVYRTAPIGLCVMDREQRIIWINEALAIMNGVSVAASLGRTVGEVVPELAGTLEPILRSVLDSGEPVLDWEICGSTAKEPGIVRYWHASYYPLRDRRGRVVGVNSAVEEVTERKRLDQALRDREAQLRALIDANPIGVVIGDIHGNIHEANNAYLAITGYDRSDFLDGGLGWKDITPLGWHPADARAIAEAQERGACTPYEKVYVRRDGSILPVYIGFTLIGETREKAAAFILDLTELKRARDDLEAALAEKTRLLDERETLLKEINHRIRNSLQLVSSMLRLQMSGGRDEVVRRQLADAARRVLTIAKLHEQLYRRPEEVRRIAVDQYLRELCSGLEQTLIAPDTRITLHFEADPADLPTDVAIHLALIVNELLTNSVKHAFAGRADGTIRVRGERLEDGGVRLTVADDGRGVPDGFDMERSAGLGMRLLQSLLRSLNATLEFESTPAGTRFAVTLPASTPDEAG